MTGSWIVASARVMRHRRISVISLRQDGSLVSENHRDPVRTPHQFGRDAHAMARTDDKETFDEHR
jgi:hypothetical protein